MSPVEVETRLVAVTGVASGDVFPLVEREVTIGRDALNQVCLLDPALSRRHCAFTYDTDTWVVRDLGSSNGTFVNGVQVLEQPLANGDRVAVGDSVLLFVQASCRRPPDAHVVDEELDAPTLKIAIDAPTPLELPSHLHVASRVEHGLRTLLRVGAVVHTMRSEADLYRELLALTRDVIPAHEAAVVVLRPGGELHIEESAGIAAHGVRVSRAVIERAIAERAAIVSRDAAASRTFRAEPPALAGVRSLLCVPIAGRTTPCVAIYLASAEAAAFDEDHLQLLTAIARVAAMALDNVRHLVGLEREAQRLHADLALAHNLVGESEPMRRVYDRLGRVSRGDSVVLIAGETGTGKELVARAIHINGGRSRKPFVAVNCAALTESLLESELFGHERGAFTGAIAQKRGKFEVADGGTLFLDEVGELAPSLQSKLLRVLQEHEFERVGGLKPIRVDVRLISATNRRLADEVSAGHFREDLYFRLNVVTLEIPPLRERRSDIPILARHFLHRLARKAGRRVTAVSEGAMACLTAHDWPGNVRELENAIERAIVLGTTEEILPEDLPEAILESAATRADAPGIHSEVLEAKKGAIIRAFRNSGGSYVETARLLAIHPNYLHRLIRNLGLKPLLTGGV